jgi:membrane protease YdiL (CAAX protease family)
MAIAFTWLPQWPAAFAKLGWIAGSAEEYMPIGALGIFAIPFAAWYARRIERRSFGEPSVLKQLTSFKAAPAWYLGALLLPGAVLFVGMALYSLSGSDLPWLYLPQAPPAVVAMVLGSISEEIGWRGYALPRLQARHGALEASVMIGVVWAVWHSMMFAAVGLPLQSYPLMIPFFIAGSILFTWLYNRPGGGLPLAVLAHMGCHLNNSHQSMPGEQTPFVVHTVGMCLVAALLVLSKREEWLAPSAPSQPAGS